MSDNAQGTVPVPLQPPPDFPRAPAQVQLTEGPELCTEPPDSFCDSGAPGSASPEGASAHVSVPAAAAPVAAEGESRVHPCYNSPRVHAITRLECLP